jgi:two-component system sensor histidine kinase LytS
MDTFNIILALAERFGLMVGGVFLLMTIAPLQRMTFTRQESRSRTMLLLALFGAFGILGTYTGNSVFQSVANLRAMVVITGGLFGGPVVGIGSGLIAGAHRVLMDLNGFSSWPCGLATGLEGAAAGLVSYWLRDKAMRWPIAFGLAVAGEIVHMSLILILSRPFHEAVELVRLIAPPMIVVNAMGASLFVEVINLLARDRERRESLHAQMILDIANLTVSYLRSGLNRESAEATAKIIHDRLGVAAVAITDTENVLAHVGAADDHHLPDRPIRTNATREVLNSGQALFLDSSDRIGCNHDSCPLTSAIIVPLGQSRDIVGTLKFYGSNNSPLNRTLFELGKGLGNLFTTQLELEDIQVKEQMLAHAEIRRLQSQINPHFLFNSLNTITSFCRTNSEKARELLMDLSLYMRRNLDLSRGFVPLSEELEQVRSYLAIEQARFGDRINVRMDIGDGCGAWPIPPLIIQPLVENAIRHGLLEQEQGGEVRIHARCENELLNISIEDDGTGMDEQTLKDLCSEKDEVDSRTRGIGLRNCMNRLKRIYGTEHNLAVQSAPGKGTTISFTVPPRQ